MSKHLTGSVSDSESVTVSVRVGFIALSFFSALLFMVTSAILHCELKAGDAAPTSRLGNLRGHSSHSDWELGNFDV